MDTLVKNTRFDNLVNYDCSSNSNISPSAIVNTSDVNSQANLIKNNIMVEYHILPEDSNRIIDTPTVIEEKTTLPSSC
jgi:hypothetical protein